MKTISRENYLQTLRGLQDKQLIKVVTGVRRCGKSTLLRLRRQELLESGVDKKRIVALNFEEPENSYLKDWHEIYEVISKRLVANDMNYVFLDEVQYIEDFEKLLVGLETKGNVDLYVTGSNARMLSSELATLLTGRSYEINMLPLSFAEYLSAFEDEPPVTVEQRFADYINYGGFPQATELFMVGPSFADSYLEGVYNTIIGRDIMKRGKVSDQPSLEKVSRYLFDNIGNFSSPNKIAGVLSDEARKDGSSKTSHHTVSAYVKALEDSYLFYSVGRLHIKGKEQLRTQEKYYAVDLGLRNMLLGREADVDMGHILENVVYLELLRRGGTVWVGKTGNKEVDFVVQDKDGYTSYYQVSNSTNEAATLKRELAPLQMINDNNPKYLLTTDKDEPVYSGIRKINVLNWLLKK